MIGITAYGNLGNDAVIGETKNGKQRLNFSLAAKIGWGEKSQTIWFSCTKWGTTAEGFVKALTKGTPVIVRGNFNVYEGKEPGEVRMGIDILDITIARTAKKKEDGDRDEERRDKNYDNVPSRAPRPVRAPDGPDDDIPF